LEAETGQPALPARRARVAWYLTWRVPAAASRPPAASARRYGIWNPVGCFAHGLEVGWTNDGVTGNSAHSGRYG
jgi:hypothetical protein